MIKAVYLKNDEKKEYTVLCSFVEWKNIFNIEEVLIKDNNGVVVSILQSS